MLYAKTKELTEQRVSKGWSKTELAKKSKVLHSSIVRAEQGCSVSPKSAKAIADALEMPVLDLFTVSTRREA